MSPSHLDRISVRRHRGLWRRETVTSIAEQVDPIYFNKSYFLEPEKGAVKPYVLLRDAWVRDNHFRPFTGALLRIRYQDGASGGRAVRAQEDRR